MKPLHRNPILAVYAAGILIVLILSLVIFFLVMKPPMADFSLMTAFLLLTAVISGLAGFAAYQLGWLNRMPSLRISLILTAVISSVLTFFNVWLTASLMFANQHDLLLSMVLLIFAGGMATILGYFLSSALAERIRQLEDASHRLANGNLDTRLEVHGRDEVARLAAAFNQMAERLEAADQKQRAAEQLRSDLVAWVGHDLQTPLSSIRAILEALADGVIEDPQAIQRYLKTAQRDVRALSLLIDDLFQMAQIDAGGLQLDLAANSLNDLISDTLESFSALAQRQGIDLQGSAAADVDPVQMDAPRIGRVLNNLVSNALRHTPEGGRVSVCALRTPRGVEVSVTDSGEGIRGADIPHIFERFYRGEKSRSRATGGAGLGLAIAQGIVRAHGGDLTVESQPGRQTCFTFWIP